MGFLTQEAADRACEQIALAGAEGCISTMFNMCGNAGQASIIEGCADDVMGQVDTIAKGSASPINCSHPEAVEIIISAGEDTLADAAARCAEIQDAVGGNDDFGFEE